MQQPGIIVTGTLDGHKTLHTFGNFTNEDISFISSDARSGLGNENDIGKECYAISFAPNGLVYRKYKIVQDSFKRPGYVAISFFVPYANRISGSVIIETLDNLLAKLNLFIPNDRLGEQNIDWHFIEDIFQPISAKIKDSYSQPYKTISSNLLDAAYIFYKPSNLVKFFDDVNQKEYYKYRQVLFLNDSEKGNENVLGLKHSVDITALIDIENPPYHIEASPTSGVQVKINGSADFRHEFKKNEYITITFSKPFHKSKPISGLLSALLVNELKDSKIDDTNKIISIETPILIEEIKNINIRVIGYPVPKENIKIRSLASTYLTKKLDLAGNILFKGDEIGQHWEISISQNKYEPYRESFNPMSEGKTKNIELTEIKYNKSDSERREEDDSTFGRKQNKTFQDKIKRLLPFLLVGFVFCAVLAILFIYINWSTISTYFKEKAEAPPIESTNSKPELSDIKTKEIIDYSKGMELMSLQLKEYKDTLDRHRTTEKIESVLDKAIKLRKAINSKDKSKVNEAYEQLSDLDSLQNKLLLLIIKYSEEYISVEDLDSKTLTKIMTEIDSLVAAKKPSVEAVSTKNKNSNTSTTSQNCNSTPCITEDEFFNALKDLLKQPKSKIEAYRVNHLDHLTQAQKNDLIQIMKNISKFNEIDKNLTQKDFLNKVKELK